MSDGAHRKPGTVILGPGQEQQAAREGVLLRVLQVPFPQTTLDRLVEDAPHRVEVFVILGAPKGEIDEAVRLAAGVAIAEAVPREDDAVDGIRLSLFWRRRAS